MDTPWLKLFGQRIVTITLPEQRCHPASALFEIIIGEFHAQTDFQCEFAYPGGWGLRMRHARDNQGQRGRIIAATSRYDADASSEQAARASYSQGDKYTAANLFLKAAQANDSIMNRFNLATAYAAIGNVDSAATLYAALVLDGQYTRMTEDSLPGDVTFVRSFNVGVESATRLAVLRARNTTSAIGDESGTGVTDAEAKRLDQEAENDRANVPGPFLATNR